MSDFYPLYDGSEMPLEYLLYDGSKKSPELLMCYLYYERYSIREAPIPPADLFKVCVS